jgi:Raf kinase inhibitor-like YbhB/YbcL family protein
VTRAPASRAPASRVRPSRVLAACALAASVLAACGGGGGGGKSLTVTSAAFKADARIPTRYSCEGDNTPPPLRWTKGPSGTVGYAIVVEDPDAPSPPFYHWVVADLPATMTSFDALPLPSGATVGIASSGSAEYVGMCPPDKAIHHYRFTVYALRKAVGPRSGLDAAAARMASQVRANSSIQGTLVGIFGR